MIVPYIAFLVKIFLTFHLGLYNKFDKMWQPLTWFPVKIINWQCHWAFFTYSTYGIAGYITMSYTVKLRIMSSRVLWLVCQGHSNRVNLWRFRWNRSMCCPKVATFVLIWRCRAFQCCPLARHLIQKINENDSKLNLYSPTPKTARSEIDYWKQFQQ